VSGLLWEIIEPLVKALRPPRPVPLKRPPPPADETPLLPFGVRSRGRAGVRPAPKPKVAAAPKQKAESSDASMQKKYDAVVAMMLEKYQIRVRKWRTSMSGIAWYVTYRDGRIQRLIESPRPKGPMSIAVFLHEIGHHAIGFNVYKPRCLEEYHAWRWALEAMNEHGLNITDQVKLRVHRSLWYAVQKAERRGIKRIPEELGPYLEKPSFARRKRARQE
jgi:hypothetical protein